MAIQDEINLAFEMCAFHATMADHHKTNPNGSEALFEWHWRQLDEWDCKRQSLKEQLHGLDREPK